MSDQKPHITDSEIDHILEQVQQRRESSPAPAMQSTEADVDAILTELGVEVRKKRDPVEPILLPKPVYSGEAGVAPARRRGAAMPASGTAQDAARQTGQQASPAGRQSAGTAAEIQQTGQQVSPAGRQSAGTAAEMQRPGQQVSPAGRQSAGTAAEIQQTGQQPHRQEPREEPAPAAETAPSAPAEPPTPTVELPDIKALSRTQARRRAAEMERLRAQARREAEEALRREADSAPQDAVPAMAESAPAPAPVQETPAEAWDAGQAEPPMPETPLSMTGSNLYGDDRFREFFSTTVMDDPTQPDAPRRKKEKGGLWGKLFSRSDGAGGADEPEGAGEYYEAAQEDGFAEAFDAIRQGHGEDDGAPRVTEPTAPFSASIVARALTGTDTFGFATGHGQKGGFSVDVDIPLSGDGTGEYETAKARGGALTPEEDLEEYSSLSDAPIVSGELAAMRQTRLVRTVFTGALALFLIYLGLSAREGWLPPIGVLDPHTAPLTYLVANFVLLAVSAFSSVTTLGAGLRGMVRKPTSDSFAALACVAAALQNAAYLVDAARFDPETTTLFAPVAALLLCGNALGKWLQMRAVCANFAVASSGEEHAAAFLLEKEQLTKRLCDGLGQAEPRLLLNRPTALVKGFLRQSFSAYRLDVFAQKLCWALCGAALVCAVTAGVLGKNWMTAFSAFAGALCLGAPLAATLACALPTQLLQKAALRCGAVVPGPSAVEALGGANTVLLRARDLFPAGSVRLHGIKTFEKERIDLAILYASSLLSGRCETLRGVFMGMLDNNEKLLEKVENAVDEVGCGFTGWIDGRRVLLGSREMMARHGVEVPSLDYEARYTKNGQRSPIYLAVSGKLFGMFLVSYQPSRRSAEAIRRLTDSGACVLVQTDDFNITAPLIAAVYGLPEAAVKVLSQSEQEALESELAYRPESEGVMIHTGACASLLGGMRAAAEAAAGERTSGVLLTASAVLGAVLAVALSVSQGLAGLSLGLAVLYQLIWSCLIAVPTLLRKP